MSTVRPPDTSRSVPGVPLANIILCIAAFFFVSLRIYTRMFLRKGAGWDDYLIIPAMVLAIAYVATEMVQVFNGHYGHHRIYLTFDNLRIIYQTNLAENILNAFVLFFARASICALLLRILGGMKLWACLIWLAIIFNAIVSIGTCITLGLLCIPLRRTYDPNYPGKCMSQTKYDNILRIWAGINCIVDFSCATIPFIALRKIEVDRRSKIGMFAILGCGLITASCSIGRAVALDFHSPDQTYDLVPLSYWVDGEMFGAIIFASIPALRQLFLHYKMHCTFRRVKVSSYRIGTSAGSLSSNVHSRKRSRLTSVATASSEAKMSKVYSPKSNEIACQTDFCVELSDLEDGKHVQKSSAAMSLASPRRQASDADFNARGGPDNSHENLRGHAAV